MFKNGSIKMHDCETPVHDPDSLNFWIYESQTILD